MKTTLVFTATLVATLASFAETISEKSPDGRNEIRLTTDPVLSYSVLRDGKERVAPTPISLTVEGKGVLGGKVKVSEAARVPHAGTLATPMYKKASVADDGNETKVTFAGGWQVFLHARNDGVGRSAREGDGRSSGRHIPVRRPDGLRGLDGKPSVELGIDLHEDDRGEA